ncbi:DUF3347 domain-containing protein [Pedobacter flavus]|uniref:DUF3347 domain-containing protein n=1 Tax=Pedobacter flavus TaxID=3113906 RepID=A0ABU7H3E7_9SPHI|nr:DUF3347 domain-containing protein [Pedobacter sp. VNH31]MEE1885557.1 DUF3347 domain-containing protein [Pedobacter sp. VNH31]
MKLISKNIGFLAVLVLLYSCQNTNNVDSTNVTDSVKTVEVKTNLKFVNPSEELIYNSYINLKDALVLADASNASKFALELASQLSKEPSFKDISKLANKIGNDTDLKNQRKVFTDLSNQLIAQFKKAKLSEGKIFVQHCPMANNGDGGDWLASEANIRNPYYGDEMLECGSVVEEITIK